MDENLSLADVLSQVAAEYLSRGDEPGMLTGFVFVGEVIGSDGSTYPVVARPDTQSLTQSLGLSTLASEWFRDDAFRAFSNIWGDED